MKKILIFFVFIISISTYSQDNFWSNVQYGGGFTIGFGSNQTTIGISPSAVYNFNNGFKAGVGLGYLFSEINDFSTSVYSTSLIGLYQTKIGIQFSTDLDYYFAEQRTFNGDRISTNFPALHLGIAYNQGRFALGIRYDVLYDENKSVFASPISPVVRFYF